MTTSAGDNLMEPKKTYVLYRANCLDGFTAAWVFWRLLDDDDGAEYIPVSYGDPPPEMKPGAEVIIVDFSYSREVLLQMAEKHKVLVLDHHKTAQKALAGLPTDPDGSLCVQFDMDRSGAMMAWDWVHKGKGAPILVEYVQDRDLWQWRLNNSKAINAYIGIQDRTFEAWDFLAYTLVHDYMFCMERGRAILKSIYQQVERICAHAQSSMWLHRHQAVIVNSPVYQSEVGHRLLELHSDAQFAGIYYRDARGLERWSLRARQDGFDVSNLAKHFGGGGHQAAAGFTIPGPPMEWISQLTSLGAPKK